MSDSCGAFWSICFYEMIERLKIVANIYIYISRVKLWKIVFKTFILTIAKNQFSEKVEFSIVLFRSNVFNVVTSHDLRSSLRTNALEIFIHYIIFIYYIIFRAWKDKMVENLRIETLLNRRVRKCDESLKLEIREKTKDSRKFAYHIITINRCVENATSWKS